MRIRILTDSVYLSGVSGAASVDVEHVTIARGVRVSLFHSFSLTRKKGFPSRVT